MAAVSYEAALAACRDKIGELAYENVLKDARIRELEAELEAQQSTAPAADATSEGRRDTA